MKNTKNLERKSSADRITCFLPLYYNPLDKCHNNNNINISTSVNRHICEQHRDELGIYWTRKKRTCAHPLHGDSKAKPDRGIDAVMSREIWLRLQLVAISGICEGNLQNHTSYICIRSPDINTTIFIFTR